MVRSILLRGFDQDIAERIGKHMMASGVKFLRNCIPTKFERLIEPTNDRPGRVRVTAESINDDGITETIIEEFDTVDGFFVLSIIINIFRC
jgi:thioredoxin reductase (NADPH)